MVILDVPTTSQPRSEWLWVGYGALRYTLYSLCKHILTSSIVSLPCSLTMSVMQLKKFFIAYVGVTVLVITNVNARDYADDNW